MSVEAKVYAWEAAITGSELITAAARRGLTIRVFEASAMTAGTLVSRDPNTALGGERQLDHVVLGWPSAAADVTATVEVAVRAGDKDAIDWLAAQGKLAWCGLNASDYDYEEFWEEFPDERPEYEESIEPERLAAIKGSRTRYALRCGVRPPQNGDLLVSLVEILREVTGGVVDE